MVLSMLLTPRKFLLLLFAGAVIVVWVSAPLFNNIRNVSGEEVPSRDALMHSRGETPPFPGGQMSHLSWFVQISDLHISRYRWKSISQDFLTFCDEYLDIIKPQVTVASGDLTDARDFNWHGSKQREFEWKVYNSILQQTNVRDKTVWLDIRGNHDAFSVPSWASSENMYRKFSVQGDRGQSYKYTHRSRDGDKYTFIAFDATPSPGPKRPFNFFGSMTEEVLNDVDKYLSSSRDSNATILFGHYPSSVVGRERSRLKQLMSRCLVYLCGHLHTFMDVIPRMYTRQQAGNMELELGDWKKSRRYRVFAVDHDLFSFVDKTFGSWPVVLITNPKHAQFNMPHYEPLGRMAHSTHIRILIFSNVTTNSVRVTVDNTNLGAAHNVHGPLYVLPWEPSNYPSSIHQIEVKVTDSQGHTHIVRQPFCLRGQCDIGFPFLARMILMNDHLRLAKLAFFVVFVISLLPLILVKLMYRRLLVAVSGTWHNCLARRLQTLLRWAYLLGATDTIIYYLMAYNVYVAVGPWFVGGVMEGYIGILFMHGIYVNGTYVPGALTYVSGMLQLIFCNIPLSLYLGHCLDLAVSQHRRPPPKRPLLDWLLRHFVFLWLLSWLMYCAIFVTYLPYGLLAGLVCPVYTWAVPFVIYLRWVALSKGQRVIPDEQLS